MKSDVTPNGVHFATVYTTRMLILQLIGWKQKESKWVGHGLTQDIHLLSQIYDAIHSDVALRLQVH